MNKCLKITFPATCPVDFLRTFVQKNARDLNLEGIAQIVTAENSIVILVCGAKEEVDQFVDVMHKGVKSVDIHDIFVEPFVKVKDYRGVFRIIE